MDIVLPIIVGIVLIPVMVGVLLLVRRGTQLSKFALPDFLPDEQPPDDPAFGKRGAYYAGSLFTALKMFGLLPVPVIGKGFHIKGSGKAWLSDEGMMIHRDLTRKPLVIPFALIHKIEVRVGFFAGKRVPGYVMHITWGRKELPITTGIQISRRRDISEQWAGEILRRADIWRQKAEAEESRD
jgi:hypothetical protein